MSLHTFGLLLNVVTCVGLAITGAVAFITVLTRRVLRRDESPADGTLDDLLSDAD